MNIEQHILFWFFTLSLVTFRKNFFEIAKNQPSHDDNDDELFLWYG